MLKFIGLGVSIFYSLFIVFPLLCSAETCCPRVLHSSVPASGLSPQDQRFFKTSVDGGFTYKGPQEADCPLSVKIEEYMAPEYLIDCDLQIMPSDIKGRYYIFTASLIDPHHGNAILAGPHHVSWHGEPKDHAGAGPYMNRNLIKELIQYLRPFDDKIHDYERLPESCAIELEKEEVEGGETTTIRVVDLKDSKGRTSKPWQRILAKVDIGKIKNGVNKHPYYVFEVGDGNVEVIYEAPEKCDYDTEIITVYNSCYWMGSLWETVPERELSRKEFKVDDRQPDLCNVRPDINPVQAGEKINVLLSRFREREGKKLRPEEKVLVKAEKGKIVNGKSQGSYKLFQIGEGRVVTSYEAPDDCNAKEDKIAVYNACKEEGSETYTPGEKIAEELLEVTCKWRWTGKLIIENFNRFSCENVHVDNISGRATKTKKNDDRAQHAILNIHADDMLPGKAIMDFNWPKGWVIGGSLKAMNTEYVQTSSDGYFEEKKTTFDELFQIDDKNVQIMVSRNAGDFESAGKKLQSMASDLAAGGGDPKKVQEAMAELRRMYSLDKNTVPLRFIVQIHGNFSGRIETVHHKRSAETGEKTEKSAWDGPVGLPMAVEFTGTMTRDPKGGGQITASGSGMDKAPGGQAYPCPDRELTWTTSLNMTAKPKKKGE